jgi:hypothetical protein
MVKQFALIVVAGIVANLLSAAIVNNSRTVRRAVGDL